MNIEKIKTSKDSIGLINRCLKAQKKSLAHIRPRSLCLMAKKEKKSPESKAPLLALQKESFK